MNDLSIDRTDLESLATEPNSPNPVLEAYFRQQLQQRYADPSQALAVTDGIRLETTSNNVPEQAEGGKGEEYEFPLFTRHSAVGPASVRTSNGPQRVILRSPSPADVGSGFTIRGRPDKYYFKGDTGPELAEQYTQAAVSGQDIIEGLRMRWRGMELPWRVTVIKTAATSNAVGSGHQSQAQTNRRKRSGKKRRIAIRQKLEARAAKEMGVRQNQAEKEAAEREKRTRRNREKKVKKKLKDKLKKVNDHGQDPI